MRSITTDYATANLGRSITRESSRQTYEVIGMMVDKNLVDDCYRAYGYLRWADDIVDFSSMTRDERISFIKRQTELVDLLYKDKRPENLAPEEEMVADLINHDRRENSGLRSFISNFLAILEFDAHRKGRLTSQDELNWYSNCLGKSVTDGIQYFIGNCYHYPLTDKRYLAATAAHITHMLRDMVSDIAVGYINIPSEYLETYGMRPDEVNSPSFRAWVRGRVEQAREYFRDGKRYLDGLDVQRCKIAGYWYCARFEGILDIIERDDYALRAVYEG